MNASPDFSDILNNLATAELSNKELNPYRMAAGEFTDLTDFIIGLKTTANKKPLVLDPANLCMNGRAIADPMETYLATPSTSSSALKQVMKTPLHYWCYLNEPVTRPEKKAFDLGTFIHQAFLEPDKFDQLVVEPKASMSSIEGCDKMITFWEEQTRKVGKAKGKPLVSYARKSLKRLGLTTKKIDGKKAYIEELKKRAGKISVDNDSFLKAKLIRRHYETYGGGILPALMKGAMYETSFYGTDPETGIQVKVRPDAFNLEENIGANVVISLKTTSAESVKKFLYDAAKFDYPMAEAMYLDVMQNVTGRKFTGVFCIALQTCPPYLPIVVYYPEEVLAAGHYRYRMALQTLKDILDTKNFPGFDSFAEEGHLGIISGDVPEWYLRELPAMHIEGGEE
ncbi:hypothetical protein BWI93_01135 [Siphonobacter sp. BAB-5385]|uniref:PD-(D/E)XK nuclease-like domain-containing protein n=1 Tax=Siphonobacter sp. BAB-5385 TaxID=1864822 RepID=UPI000B9EBAC5|nr:PD-(D/E)XK nuclease-like domain-containing protein [Siphonobacter sp. BAB-5385]OZI09974.1 hypothetical protein BWI93_01135 [Siphonobacter sp. BAB-5385]